MKTQSQCNLKLTTDILNYNDAQRNFRQIMEDKLESKKMEENLSCHEQKVHVNVRSCQGHSPPTLKVTRVTLMNLRGYKVKLFLRPRAPLF